MAYVSERTCFPMKYSFSFFSDSLPLCLVQWCMCVCTLSRLLIGIIACLKFAMLFQFVIGAVFQRIFSCVINLLLTKLVGELGNVLGVYRP